MNRSLRLTILFSASLLFGSCEDSTTSVYAPHNFADAVRYYRNVPWTLSHAMTSDTVVDLSKYTSFLMFLNDSSVFGYDGCNWYNAIYELHGDTVSINFVGRTERGCIYPKEFRCQVLEDKWCVTLSGNTLSFAGLKSFLQFKSDVTEPLGRYSFVGKRLKLSASNDSLFPMFDSLRVFPLLQLSDDREFILSWNCWLSTGETSASKGYYGIGPDSTIQFAALWTGWCRPVQYPIRLYDRTFALSFNNSNHFSMADSTVTFFNTETGIYFRFLQERSPARGDE